MKYDDESFAESEWTPEERAQLDALSAERQPPERLRDRAIAALEDRALLERPRRARFGLMLGLLAAASIVFAVGAAVGYQVAARRVVPQANERARARTRELARSDSATTPTPARHVVWF